MRASTSGGSTPTMCHRDANFLRAIRCEGCSGCNALILGIAARRRRVTESLTFRASRAMADAVHIVIGQEHHMRMKIRGATPVHGETSLCDSCRHSKITRGRRLDEELVVCTASHVGERRITFKVTSCTHYEDQRLPSYYEFMQQAWIFQPGSLKRGAGFVRASDLREADVQQFLAAMKDAEQR